MLCNKMYTRVSRILWTQNFTFTSGLNLQRACTPRSRRWSWITVGPWEPTPWWRHTATVSRSWGNVIQSYSASASAFAATILHDSCWGQDCGKKLESKGWGMQQAVIAHSSGEYYAWSWLRACFKCIDLVRVYFSDSLFIGLIREMLLTWRT